MNEEEVMRKGLSLLNQFRELGFSMEHITMEGYETWIIFKKLKS